MGDWVRIAVWGLRSGLRSRRTLALENVALREQLMVLRRQKAKVRLKDRDRVFWIWLRRVWPGWRQALVLVEPATVVGWHRRGFRAYWRWRSRPKGGRPRIDPSVRGLIRHMWSSNPTWGAPRIQAELHKLGIEVSDSTVRRYRPGRPRQASPNWRSFLENHLGDIAAMDFFVVPTATFRVLYVLVIMAHDRRRILHFNVTTSPNAAWTARQLIEAFPYDTQPRFLLHDRDKCFAGDVAHRVRSLGVEEVLTAPGSPWQNAYCERLIGSIRRECLDHVVVLNERHLLRILRSYASYYHASRTHRSLDGDAPDGRDVEPPAFGEVIARPQVGGLHHRYARRAA